MRSRKVKLSKHFIEKWRDKLGYMPSKKQVEKLIDESICVQKGKVIRRNYGESFIVPTILWNIERNLMFKVDEINKTVITVYVGGEK